MALVEEEIKESISYTMPITPVQPFKFFLSPLAIEMYYNRLNMTPVKNFYGKPLVSTEYDPVFETTPGVKMSYGTIEKFLEILGIHY
jgi:hypothetical protein